VTWAPSIESKGEFENSSPVGLNANLSKVVCDLSNADDDPKGCRADDILLIGDVSSPLPDGSIDFPSDQV